MVELEVAGVDDDADRRPEGDPHRVGDGMADPEGDDAERPDLDLVAGLHGQERVVVELVLLDLAAEETAGEGRGVDRDARELRQHVGQAADVVLVGVGDQERPDVGLALLEVGDVGNDEVDPEHLLVGEHQPAVDHDDVVAVLEHVHVLADLADAAERDDPEDRVGGRHQACWKIVRSSGSAKASAAAGSVIVSAAASAAGRAAARRARASRRARGARPMSS